MKIGVLAIQGNFIDHINILKKLNISAIEVRNLKELNQVDGLIIPGGESTSIGVICEKHEMIQGLKDFIRQKPVWGVCAGAILISGKIKNLQMLDQHSQPILGGIDCTVIRNFFGSQINSDVQKIKLNDGSEQNQYFIRAPIFESVSNKVEVLARLNTNGMAVAIKQNNIMATVFHPELQTNLYWHLMFLNLIQKIDVQNGQQLLDYHYDQVKRAFPQFLKGGVIMDVVNEKQAKVAESAGACCVMALERIPADIKQDGGIARMSDPKLIKEIQQSVSIPVMAKARIGHFGEAMILQQLKVDCIDESEVLTMADKTHHIDKHQFRVPFVCGARNLGEALRRISEGASMIRVKGDAGTGNIVNAVEHMRSIFGDIRKLISMSEDELYCFAKELRVEVQLVKQVKQLGRLPVVTFAAGGIATPADVILCMHMGCDGVFVGSGIFKSSDPEIRAKAIVDSCTFYNDLEKVAKSSEGLGKPMVGLLTKGEEYAYVKPKL